MVPSSRFSATLFPGFGKEGSESETRPNTVVRFDPKGEKFQTWEIPGGGNIVRNTDVTKDGNFVLANSLTNQVTLVRIGK